LYFHLLNSKTLEFRFSSDGLLTIEVWKIQILGPCLIPIKVFDPSPTVLVKIISCSPSSPPLCLAQLDKATPLEMVFQGHQNKIHPKIKESLSLQAFSIGVVLGY